MQERPRRGYKTRIRRRKQKNVISQSSGVTVKEKPTKQSNNKYLSNKGKMISGSHTWKEFTPEFTDKTRCLARTWSKGRGGQCRCFPTTKEHICRRHNADTKTGRGPTHGLVSGSIPQSKLLAFQKKHQHSVTKKVKAVRRSR